MRIVIDARQSGTSTGRYVDKLVEYLHKLRSAHEFVVLSKDNRVEYLQSIAPSFSIITTPYKEFTFGEQLGFKRQLRKLRADVVHFPMVQQPVFYKGKTVTTMNDLTTVRFTNPAKNPLIFRFKQRVYVWVNRRVARKATWLITYSEFVKYDVAEFTHIDPDKITAIPLAADLIREPAEPLEALVGAQFLMYVGRPMPHKNLPRLIEAFRLLKATHPELKLVLAGKKDVLYERLEQSLSSKQLQDILFTDFVGDAQLRWLYENCAAYVFPSLSEGFGLPGLEAMAHGAPVVSSNATCLPEIYGDAAHYFDPMDVQAMSDAINEVLTDKQLRTKLVAAGKKQAALYSWEQLASKTLAVYERTQR
jgi:glycosyltransferase involved in cell wall biosynthesis